MTERAGGSPRFLLGIVALGWLAVLLGLLLFAPPDGKERAQFLQFAGRFHPLSVHLPIALLIVVPLVELAGRTRYFPGLLASASFLLALAAMGATGAATLGWCLARSGGFSGSLVRQHMWAGIVVAAAAWICWILRNWSEAPGQNRFYGVALAFTVAAVFFAGHRGGQLTQGENYLTELMPEPLASWFEIPLAGDAPPNSPNGGPGTFFGARIKPVLDANCVSCHGTGKHKARLRLDNYEAVMRGGKSGPAIKPGDARGSDLFRRINLPPTHRDFMPVDKEPLRAGDVKLIELWIAAGASGTAPVNTAGDAGAATSSVAEIRFPDVDAAAVEKQRAAIAGVVSQLQQRYPNTIDYESRSSADVVVNAAWMGAKFGDADVAALEPIAEHIVSADFSNTAITDQAAGGIAAMKRLRALRLMRTKIGDAGLQQLGAMSELESLSVFGTKVTANALPAMARLPKLQHVYAGETAISADAKLPEELARKIVF
jgi:uncharacterized membrane protein